VFFVVSCCAAAACVYRAELYSDHFMEFFERVEVANFEIASDAFSSFKVCSHTTSLTT
jgi:hypothetical protein